MSENAMCHRNLGSVSRLGSAYSRSKDVRLARPITNWLRSRSHLSKSDTPGNFSKLSTEKTGSNDSFHSSLLKRRGPILWFEVQRHDGMQARCSGREFEMSQGSRNLIMSDYVAMIKVEVLQRGRLMFIIDSKWQRPVNQVRYSRFQATNGENTIHSR